MVLPHPAKLLKQRKAPEHRDETREGEKQVKVDEEEEEEEEEEMEEEEER